MPQPNLAAQTSSMDSILEVSNLSIQFGGIVALRDINFSVPRASITALIGPNGAGKTTIFNCLTGFYRAAPNSRIRLNTEKNYNLVQLLGEKFQLGDLINPAAFASRLYYKMFGGTHLVSRVGLARTFQNNRLFQEMTAVENLLVAQHVNIDRRLLSGILKTSNYRRSEQEALEKAFYWLDFLQLSKSANKIAGELPYGEQKRLEIARAMCTSPKLLCLDEPAAGLNSTESNELSELIKQFRAEQELTVLIIEHDMKLVMSVADYIIVLNYGEVLFDGSPEEVRNNPAVIDAYLGND